MNDSLWYKDAIIYEVHVRAFEDSNADGLGDFRGLTERLDYLQDLGITAIWLLPFFPSPWRDDGYDISNYTDVHPAYGNLRDFQHFLKEAHRRNLRVITEVVLNHTSDQHPWFQRSRRAQPGSKWRDFYVWGENPERYREARIIFKDFESSNWAWDPVAKAYYWHRFYSHQPELNYDSPAVRQAVLSVIDFWLDMGVDGFRLDAVPYLFEREETNCENLPETHHFLKELRRHVDQKYPDRMLLAEANQWPEDAIAYFGEGDECHMAFHFPLMPRLFVANRMEDRYPIVDILNSTPQIPRSCQWALFLRNHDELTLEMVTDEERDYMYRTYAHDRQMRVNLGIRRRLAALLDSDRRKIELMSALLFSLPGTPVIYYGDEIGMGDNIYLGDRNGVRTPMQWSADRNAGFSRANPQRLYLPVIIDPQFHYEAVNVESQQNNPHSLLWWNKRVIQQRNQYKAFGRGSLEFLFPDNRRVLAFFRRYEEENILVVANLSRFPQHAVLDLGQFKGMTPVEVFGRTEFPPVGDTPYTLTLGANSFYWFSLEPRRAPAEAVTEIRAPALAVENFDEVFSETTVREMTRILPRFLRTRRWFRGAGRSIRNVGFLDVIPIPDTPSYLVLAQVEYAEGDPDIYVLAAAVAAGEEVEKLQAEISDTLTARLRSADGQEGVLYSAIWNKRFAEELLTAIARRRRFHGQAGELVASHTRAFRKAWGADRPRLEPVPLRVEQDHSSIAFADRFMLKVFRKVEPGPNPEIEMGAFLTEKDFPHAAPIAGWIEYVPNGGDPIALAVLHGYVANHGDAWSYTVDALGQFYESALARPDRHQPPACDGSPLSLAYQEAPQLARETIGAYLESARLLGARTAEMHLALTDPEAGPDFAPEPFSDFYRQGLYHGMAGLMTHNFQLLRQELRRLPEEVRAIAQQVVEQEGELRRRFRVIRDRRISAARIRHHGDFQLTQVLYTGKDFVFVDFEGEPTRPMSERRIKRSALRDVAGMLRSFHYAAYAVLYGLAPGVTLRPESTAVLDAWAAYWYTWVGALYLRGYLDRAGYPAFLPKTAEELRVLLEAYLFEKAAYEIGWELANRPGWLRIPLRGLLGLLA